MPHLISIISHLRPKNPKPSASLCQWTLCFERNLHCQTKMGSTANTRIPTMRNFLLPLIKKRFLITTSSSSPATLDSPISPSPSSSFTVQFLVNSCGLSLTSALSLSQKFRLDENSIQKSQTVLQFLKDHGFTDFHIAKMITKWPTVLRCKVEDNLKPKFDFLTKNGFVGQLLAELITTDPPLLRRKLDSHIKPFFELLQPFLDSSEGFIAVQKRNPLLFSFNFKNSLRLNIDFLIKEGVPVDKIKKLIMLQPRALLLMHDRAASVVNALKNLGLDPKSPVFLQALRVMTQMSESTWRRKIELMKNLGWSEEEILSAFKRYPHLLACSEKKITSNMDFLLNNMKVGRQAIVERPLLLMFSVDKRFRPRHAVLKALESKKLIKRDMKIECLLVISDKYFLKRYVTKFIDEVPDLLQIYCGKGEAKTIDC